MLLVVPVTGRARATQDPSFLFFGPFFGKILSNRPLAERFQKIDPQLDVIVDGAKI
jgi:hypothetical protein